MRTRRSFAAPFVITLALAPVASADMPPPPKSPPSKNPPAPKERPPERAKAQRSWTITKSTAKTAKPTDCVAFQTDACPPVPAGKPIPPCNPPMPTPYACPTNAYGIGKVFTAKDALKIVLRAGATECVIDEPVITCEPGEKCNPPPPRTIACPK